MHYLVRLRCFRPFPFPPNLLPSSMYLVLVLPLLFSRGSSWVFGIFFPFWISSLSGLIFDFPPHPGIHFDRTPFRFSILIFLRKEISAISQTPFRIGNARRRFSPMRHFPLRGDRVRFLPIQRSTSPWHTSLLSRACGGVFYRFGALFRPLVSQGACSFSPIPTISLGNPSISSNATFFERCRFSTHYSPPQRRHRPGWRNLLPLRRSPISEPEGGEIQGHLEDLLLAPLPWPPFYF